MGHSADAAEIDATFGELTRRLAGHPVLGPRLRRADAVVRFSYRDPEAMITADLREGGSPGRVEIGEGELEPEVTLSMSAGTAHRLWLGELELSLAVARGELRVSGVVAKAIRLLPLLGEAAPLYRALLESQGRGALLDPATA